MALFALNQDYSILKACRTFFTLQTRNLLDILKEVSLVSNTSFSIKYPPPPKLPSYTNTNVTHNIVDIVHVALLVKDNIQSVYT